MVQLEYILCTIVEINTAARGVYMLEYVEELLV